MTESNNQWKNRVQNALNNVSTELKKTTDIGVRMFNASKENGNLKEAYAELGKLVAQEITAERLELKNSRAQELLTQIKECEAALTSLESEVNDIRFKK